MKKIITFLLILTLSACSGGGGSSPNGTNHTNDHLPDLVLTSITAPDSLGAGERVSIEYEIKNQGNTAAHDLMGAVPVSFFLSQDNVINPLSDLFIGSDYPNGLTGIASDERLKGNITITIPNSVASGRYYLGAYVDSREVADQYITYNFPMLPSLNIKETREDNNSIATMTEISISGSFCSDSVLEDDDIAGSEVVLGQLVSDNFCFDSVDNYVLHAQAGTSYSVYLSDHSEVHVSVFNESGEIIRTATTGSNEYTSFTLTSNEAQVYTIEVALESLRMGNLDVNLFGSSSQYFFLIN